MFLIPVGHENSRVNRFPVVSTVMVIACLVGFAGTWPRCEREQEEILEAFQSIHYKAAALHGAKRAQSEDEDGPADEDDDGIEAAAGPHEFLDAIEKTLEKDTSRGASDEDQERLA